MHADWDAAVREHHHLFLVNLPRLTDTRKVGDRYPYLLAGEIPPMVEAFAGLFAEQKTRQCDDGRLALYEPVPRAKLRLMQPLTPQQLETLAQRLRPEDRERLRSDGLLNPKLPPMCLCGGLEAPYLVVPASPPSVLPASQT